MVRLVRAWTLLFLAWVGGASTAYGHALGESYVVLEVEETRLSGNIEINERELASQFGVSLESTWTQSSQQVLLAYLLENFQIQVEESELALQYGTPEVLSLPQGLFLQLGFEAQWPSEMPAALLITQRLFFEADSRHRSLLLVERNAVSGATYDWERTALVFSPYNVTQELDLRELPGLSGRLDFLVQGAWHILIGYDHILFLLTLLLTAVMVWGPGRWLPETSFRKALWNVAAIVTVFTLAHSITLSLAALGWVSLPSWLIESVIALSIVIVALQNLRPFLPNQWLVIFFFGLFHGLGFAGVMEHLSFRMTDLLSVLVMFNIGVELGQLAIVCTAFPLLYAVRKKSWYVPVVIYGGSVVIAIVASVWLLQRLTSA